MNGNYFQNNNNNNGNNNVYPMYSIQDNIYRNNIN